MNTIKLMTDVMKAREKDGSRMEWIYSDYTDDRCCVLNKHAIYIVDSYRFYLDVEKTFEKTVDAKKFIDPSNPLLVNVIDTGITRKHEALTCRCLKSENFEVWIDEKYLKYLNKDDLRFMASSPKEPVYVYEDDVFVAVILPVVFKS